MHEPCFFSLTEPNLDPDKDSSSSSRCSAVANSSPSQAAGMRSVGESEKVRESVPDTIQ